MRKLLSRCSDCVRVFFVKVHSCIIMEFIIGKGGLKWIMLKLQLKNEIKFIHLKYNEGVKNVKPSFNFIIVNIGNDDFIVTNSLQKAKEKAIEYGNKFNEIFDIYEVEFYPDKTYRAVIKYSYFFTDEDIHEEIEIYNCLHIAWRTRGDLLEVCY